MNAKSRGRKKLTATDARNLRTLLLLNVFEPERIGARIARARTEAGVTQEELADLVGVSTRSLQGYEAGAVKPYRHLDALASALNRPVAWFLHGDDVAPDPQRMTPLLGELEAEVARFRHLNDALEAELAPARPDHKQREQ